MKRVIRTELGDIYIDITEIPHFSDIEVWTANKIMRDRAPVTYEYLTNLK